MPCYKPLTGYRSRKVNPSGKRSIVFNPNDGFVDMEVTVPCGRCIGCRLEYSRQWAIRCMHEAALYDNNCFITLTYRDECLPESGSLRLKDFQDFMKRLRKKFGSGIRFYHCGEYGDKFKRPHYHACIFNMDFDDRVLWRVQNDVPLYRSPSLEKLWPFGYSSVGNLTFESAAYVARYILKKQTGEKAWAHYADIDFDTGEIKFRDKEYTTMSRRPGIAAGWYEKFKGDVYPSDSVIVRGREMRPPRFYDGLYELESPEELLKLKKVRKIRALKNKEDNSYLRLSVREKVITLATEKLVRSYEDGTDEI